MISTLSSKSAASRLIEALLARGVDTFFGIPGGPICPIFEAIRAEPRVRLIESRHETNAAFAAALYHRASGKIPAVVVTAGPGATNVVTGVASASLERIPMLVIVGDVAWATSGGCMAQDSGPEGIHIEAIFASITRAQVRVAASRSIVSQGMSALDSAMDPSNPGPAVLVVPLDRSMAECEATEITPKVFPRPMAVPEESLRTTVKLLQKAWRPLVVLGAGCRGHEEAVLDLINALDLPFVTTPRAKGLVDEKHPNSLRNGGMGASLWARAYTKEPVDVCLTLGTDLDDTSMGPTKYLGSKGRLIHVDTDARVFNRNLPVTLGVTADLGEFARALTTYVNFDPVLNDNATRALLEAKMGSPCDVKHPIRDDHTPIRPHCVLAELEALAGPKARFVTDIGEHMLFALHYLTAKPDSFYIQLNLGSMGSGIAGAIGLAAADPTRRVVCICGDGGMQMAGMEVLVALREKLPILFVVFNDGRYNMVHHGMKQIFGVASQYDMPRVNFAAWAQSFKMPSFGISSPGTLSENMLDILLADGPAVLDVQIDESARIRGGGRVESLQNMSMLSSEGLRV